MSEVLAVLLGAILGWFLAVKWHYSKRQTERRMAKQGLRVDEELDAVVLEPKWCVECKRHPRHRVGETELLCPMCLICCQKGFEDD